MLTRCRINTCVGRRLQNLSLAVGVLPRLVALLLAWALLFVRSVPFDTLAMWLAIAVDRPLVDVVLGLESLDLVAQEFLSKQCAARILWSRLKSDFKARG